MQSSAQPHPTHPVAQTLSHSPQPNSRQARQEVGLRETCVSDGSDDARREVEILHAGREIEAHMALYAETGDLGERGAADAARIRMEALIRGRSADVVRRLEQERGLA